MTCRFEKEDENPNASDEEEDEENSPPTTPISGCPVDAARWLKFCLFGRRIKNGLEVVNSSLF